jgi:GntR family transcriptional regulator
VIGFSAGTGTGGKPVASAGLAASASASRSPGHFCIGAFYRLAGAAWPISSVDGVRKVYDYTGTLEQSARAVDININLTDGVPLYRQIVNQIRYMVASGVLEVGEELPPIRTLALQLKVTPNTIVKAYDELQAAGVVVKRHGSGTFVSDAGPSRLATRERRRIIEERIDALLAEARHLNFSLDDLFNAIRRRQALIAAKNDTSKASGEE